MSDRINPSLEKHVPCNDYYYQQEELRMHYNYWRKQEQERVKEINSEGVKK
jgi:hypothetical protein